MTRTEFIRTVRYMLADGFGVEDIALRIDCGAEEVRRLVKALRATGELARMFAR